MTSYNQMTRVQILDMEREASNERSESVRAEVLAFIKQRPPAVASYLVTLRKDGRPHTRPVSTFIEGWTVGTISQGEHLKNQHIRRNPQVGYLWIELCPAAGRSPRSVWMQGTCEVIEDEQEVQDFFARRKAAIGQGDLHPDEDWKRLLLRTTPTLVRAEGFFENHNTPALYRSFQ